MQKKSLVAALEALVTIDTPGGIAYFEERWPKPPGRIRVHPPEPSPITALMTKKPWLLPKLMQRKIPKAARWKH